MRIEAAEEFTVVGLFASTNNAFEAAGTGQIPALWKRLGDEEIAAAVRGREGTAIYAVYSDYASDENGDFTFTLGMRVAESAAVPDGFRAVRIHKGQYAVFTAEPGPPWSSVPALWKQIWAADSKQLGGTRAFETDFEEHRPSGEIEIYVGLTRIS